MFKGIFGGGNFVSNYQWFRLGPFEYCENCLQIRYMLNFITYKICVEKFSEAIEKICKKYVKNIKNEPFFYFCSRETKINLSLDDPDFKEIRTLRKFGIWLIFLV